jgi:hypothetical protein
VTALYCPGCKARGPISAIRHIAQMRDLTDDHGEDISGSGEWEYANPVRGDLILRCGACGRSWRSKRDIPAAHEP